MSKIKIQIIFKSFFVGFCLSSVGAAFLYYFSNVTIYGVIFIVGLFSFAALITGIISAVKSKKLEKDRT